MNRNQLRGSLGDELNVIFAAAGFNIRKLMRAFALFLYQFFKLGAAPQPPFDSISSQSFSQNTFTSVKNRRRTKVLREPGKTSIALIAFFEEHDGSKEQ